MTIEVGQILDKYELLEEVGQGGMAVVYRGMDRSLRREVAVKVLHRHLASHKEARDRFEREAHAVAKLRHENILEIFDFSQTSSSESYIVTEFIDGQTLRQFITDHRIQYPEIGALIVAQVCKALHHAHGIGILHRDVKPENIMVRRDGVVKLMDFGIAQMVDLQRMTVTGQLLGSPAYMSPEHVEGRPLDFRTDVFSVGILLYQLVTGELPFNGRNPHEILKRIAECRFRPAQHENPLVGKELDRIISRALARLPDDRYADISEMLRALTDYLDDSGLDDQAQELSQYFTAPPSYEMALKTRLASTLTRRGRELLEDDRVAAIEMFNRVLTLDPTNEEVLAQIDRLSRRARGRQLAFVALGALAVAGIALGARSVISGRRQAQPVAAVPFDDATLAAATAAALPDASVVAAPPDAAPPAAPPPPDARERAALRARNVVRRTPPVTVSRKADAGVAAITPPPAAARTFTLNVYPPKSEYRIDGGEWKPIRGHSASIEVGADARLLDLRNPGCCESQSRLIAGNPGGPIVTKLGWLPARITLECKHPGTRAQIDGRGAELGRPIDVPIGENAIGSTSLEVAFFSEDEKLDKQRISVSYKEVKVVTCEF